MNDLPPGAPAPVPASAPAPAAALDVTGRLTPWPGRIMRKALSGPGGAG